ncbi:hypothetical protein KIL84_007682 [Mauremys mutica]|uniref:Gypsy retrotransposon integrase-like protein 1 n=1 Tax=Mauremys mutica TaxID=74926 RepID=A0A9D4AVU8_9SAUR|nr:hypothetical protein KIL84_007682 [Mauremys mutica]
MADKAVKSFEEKIAQVLAYKRTYTYPKRMNKAGRLNLRRFAAKFSLEEGTLFRSARGRKVVVLHTMKQARQLFEQYHDNPQGRHQGIFKTREALTTRYYWPGMTKDITDWVSRCLHCQEVQQERNLDTTLKSVKVSQPFELVGMDLIGPLPATKEGYQYILTATDYLTRWVHAFPLKNKSAPEVAKKMYEFIYQYGWPQRILTGPGSEFTNELNLELCKKIGIQRSFISPYHGLAENTNKSIKRALRKSVDDSATNWDEFLGDIVFSLRTKPNMTTKFSPYQLLYGFEARLPDQVSDSCTVGVLQLSGARVIL